MQAVIFDIGHTLVDYKNPLNWRALYKEALKNMVTRCQMSWQEKQYRIAISILEKYNTRLNPRVK